MILFFSGGGTPWLPERVLQEGAVMLSHYVDGAFKRADSRPGSRMRRLFASKRKARKLVKK